MWFSPTRQNRAELTCQSTRRFLLDVIERYSETTNTISRWCQEKETSLRRIAYRTSPRTRAPTAAELALQEANDERVMTLLKFRLGPILTELKRNFRKFTNHVSVGVYVDEIQSLTNVLTLITSP